MNDPQRRYWQTAAELFAMSILEICPKIAFQTIRANVLGFFCDFLSPEPLHKNHIDLAVRGMKDKINKKIKIECIEMLSTNLVDYLKYLKQPLRARAVDCQNQFSFVVKIADVYADLLEMPLEVDFDQIRVIEMGQAKQIGNAVFHKKTSPLYRIEGVAFAHASQLKAHKKMIQDYGVHDHRKHKFEGEVIALWRSIYDVFAQELRALGYCEKWRGANLEEGCFAEYDEEISDATEFGLKANGRFRGIKFNGKRSLEKLQNMLPFESSRDIYGIEWPLIEYREIGKIWIDRILSYIIEQKSVSKMPFCSTFVTK